MITNDILALSAGIYKIKIKESFAILEITKPKNIKHATITINNKDYGLDYNSYNVTIFFKESTIDCFFETTILPNEINLINE